MVRYHRRGRLGCLFTVVAHVESRIGRFYSYNGCNFPFQGCGSETEVSGHYFSYIGHLSPYPGAGIYWTVYYLITEQLRLAVYNGYEAVKVAIAIVLGIVVIFELPQGWFWWAVKK